MVSTLRNIIARRKENWKPNAYRQKVSDYHSSKRPSSLNPVISGFLSVSVHTCFEISTLVSVQLLMNRVSFNLVSSVSSSFRFSSRFAFGLGLGAIEAHVRVTVKGS